MPFHPVGHAARTVRARRHLLCSASIVALALSPVLMLATPVFAATNSNWGAGTTTTTDYGLSTNWDNGVPTAAGQTATFSSGGNTSVILGSTVAPDAWSFDLNSQNYTITGSAVTLATSLTDSGTGAAISIANNIGGTAVLNMADSTGTLTLSGTNGYTGVTTIASGTLALTAFGSIASSSSVADSGIFDITGVSTTVNIISLSGGGTVALGGKSLNLTAAADTFSGTITGTSGANFTVGGGTEILTGSSSSYAGTYTVATGAQLTVGAGAFLGTGGIAVNGTGQVNFNRTGTLLVPNVFSGNGVVVQTAGTTVLSGDNSGFTGTTTINGGTLQIGNGGTTGSLPGTGGVVDNATLTFNRSSTIFVANSISTTGTGALVQIGSGTVILTNSNSYGGGETINQNTTLQVGNGGSTGTLGGGTTTDNGSLVFNLVAVGFYPDINLITGTGSVTVAGSQPLQYGTAMTYSGATNINTGTTLQLSGTGQVSNSAISDSGTFSIAGITASGTSIKSISGAGAVALGTKTLTITSGTGAFTGTISGTGGLTISGGSELFNTAQAYTGTTTINTGTTLTLGAGGSLAGAVVANGTLAYSSTGTVTLTSFTGITGSGGVGESGGGTLIINSQSPLTGTSGVTSGILEVGDTNNPTASLAGGVIVASTGTLEGHGTVNGAVTVLSGGTLRPGGSIGTLTVTGSASIPAGATFTEEFSNTAASKLVASGAVTLGGNLVLVSDSTTYTGGTDYKFITGSSVTGTFASVSGAPSGTTTTIQYSASAVDLILGTAATPATTITTYLFNSYGKTPNQIAAGAALTASAYNSPLYVAVGGVVSSNLTAVPATLGQLAGDIHPSLRSATIEDARMVRDTMLGHMQRDPDGPIVWAAGFGNFGNISDSNAANIGHRSGGFLVGGDLPIAATNNELRLGISGGYSTDNASTSGHLSTANGNMGHAGAYVSYTADAVHFYAGDDYGFGSVNIARSVSTLGAVLTDSQSQHSNQTFAELGYHAPWDMPVDPYLGIANVSSGQSAFTEAGGTAALSGAAASDSEAFTTLGLRSSFDDAFSIDDASLTPHIDLGWEHALQKLTPSQTVTFQSTGQSFLVLGVPLSRDAAAIKAGIDVKQGPITLFLNYDGEFASRVTENGISGGIDWQF